MTVTTLAGWRADGSPRQLSKPIAEIKRSLTVIHGAAAVAEFVGTLGNRRHLEAKIPQDHCPFSVTGWPEPHHYPNIDALDNALPGFRRLARFWITEKRGGRAGWVKYINLDGWHYSWQPDEDKRPSDDDPGHSHLSIRSDWWDRSIAYGWTTVRPGDRGPGPRAVQRRLIAHGEQLAADGIYGPITTGAVRRLQAARRILVDGITGPRTWVELAVF